MYSRLMSCVVAVSLAFMSSAAMAAKDSSKTKKEPAPVKKSSSSDIVYTPGVFYGTKSLNKTDWSPLQSQSELGLSVAVENPDWQYTVVAIYSSSKASGKTTPDIPDVEFDGSTSEIGLGLRHVIEGDSDEMNFFIEGGAVQISAKFSGTDLTTGEKLSNSDSALGYWVGGGLDYQVSDTFSVGLEARMSAADVKLFGLEVGAGGTHLGVTLRYHPE